MDIIQQCLNLVPVPCLGGAFGLLKSINDAVQRMKTYKLQFKELAKSIAALLSTLNDQYQRKEALESSTSEALSSLESLLMDIFAMIGKYHSYGIFKMFFIKEDVQLVINSYNQRITAAINSFQITAALDIQIFQQRNANARVEDQAQLLTHLRKLESNQNLIMQELHVNQMDPMVTVVAMQKRLDNKTGDYMEQQIMSHSISYIKKATNTKPDKIESWTFTPLELIMDKVICEGGFGTVWRAKWRGTDVAVKRLKNEEGVAAKAKDLCHEIKTWSKLLHPHILQFLGANTLIDDPFIVMPFMKHGNARDYLRENPECDRLSIIHQISLGIAYLHSENVIHGDLKAANVLIDDGEKAILCDFGLSRIKEDVDSRSSNKTESSVQGSLYWMAPERLDGSSLRKPCDIYSFAMTMYEIYTDSYPLGGVLPADFREVVAVRQRRPERPSQVDAPELTNAVWELMKSCWAAKPTDRPDIAAVLRSLTTTAASSDSIWQQRSDTQTRGISGSRTNAKPRTQTNHSFYGEAQSHGSVLGEKYSSEPETMKANEASFIRPELHRAGSNVYNNTTGGSLAQPRPPFEYAQPHGDPQHYLKTHPRAPAQQPHNAYTNPYGGNPHNYMYAHGSAGDHTRPQSLYPLQEPNHQFGYPYNPNGNSHAYPNSSPGFVGGFRPMTL